MATTMRGEHVTVTKFCGPANAPFAEETRSRYQITDMNGKFVDISEREARELIIILQASIIDWRGTLEAQ